ASPSSRRRTRARRAASNVIDCLWHLLAAIVVTVLVSVALAPKPPTPKPAQLSDLDAPSAEDGRPIPVVFGAVLLRGANVVWYGDLSAEPIKKKSGKK